MTIIVTPLTSGYDTTTHPTVTASISPASGSVVYAFVAVAVEGGGATNGSESLSAVGAGLSWSTIGHAHSSGSNRRALFLMRGTGTPSAGAVTFTFSTGVGTWTETAWSIVQVTGLDGTTPNGTAATAFTSSSTSNSVTIGDTPAAGDIVLAGFSVESNDTTPTLNGELDAVLHSLNGGTDVRALITALDYTPDANPAPGITWTGTNSSCGVGVLLKKAGAAAAGPAFRRSHIMQLLMAGH